MAHHVHGRVLEVGGGLGNLTRVIADHATEVVSLEPVERFAEHARNQFADNANVRCLHGYLADYPIPETKADRFDTVISFNVVEHIEDDITAHQHMRAMLRPGGKVITFVPAGMWAYGKLDQELGHFRRYSLITLRQTMEHAGLRWIEGAYHNRIGALGWYYNSRILKKCNVPVGQARLFNRLLPAIRLLERLLPLPFGQSVIGVGLHESPQR